MTWLKCNRQLSNIQGEILSTSMSGTKKPVKQANEGELFTRCNSLESFGRDCTNNTGLILQIGVLSS